MALPDHLKYVCDQVNLTCTLCNFVAKRDAMHKHFVCKELQNKEKAEISKENEKFLKEKSDDKELIETLLQAANEDKVQIETQKKERSELKQKLQTFERNQQANKQNSVLNSSIKHLEESKEKPITKFIAKDVVNSNIIVRSNHIKGKRDKREVKGKVTIPN